MPFVLYVFFPDLVELHEWLNWKILGVLTWERSFSQMGGGPWPIYFLEHNCGTLVRLGNQDCLLPWKFSLVSCAPSSPGWQTCY